MEKPLAARHRVHNQLVKDPTEKSAAPAAHPPPPAEMRDRCVLFRTLLWNFVLSAGCSTSAHRLPQRGNLIQPIGQASAAIDALGYGFPSDPSPARAKYDLANRRSIPAPIAPLLALR